MEIIWAVLLLAILVAVHEAGHFWAARATGIAVKEYAIGFGPKLIGWKSKKHETDFSIRVIPFGGFCAFYGEDDVKGEEKDDPRCFGKQKLWKRMITILMGPGMNFLLAFVVALFFYWIGGVNVATGVDPYIAEVAGAGPAYSAGLRDGDVVETVNGVSMLDGTVDTLLNTISQWKEEDGPLRMQVLREGERLELEVTPQWDEAEKKMRIGVMIGGRYRTENRKVGFLGAAGSAWNLCVSASGAILEALRNLVTTGEGLDQTSGPVGIVRMVSGEVREGGFSAFVQLLTLISIYLGLMNLLPSPGLDGSRLVFGLIEWIRRKPVPPEKEAMVNMAGMVFLFGILIFFTFQDVMRIFQ